MAVFYRIYRPTKFTEVIGQEHILTPIKQMIIRDKIGHAFLFAGPRGTGKTTIARLLAKVVNCHQASEGEPCDSCESCLRFKSGGDVDVVEIDAASNRGIDDIRELKEKIGFSPTLGRFRVYIIDEVHMLTKEAFNALLKTLEEPPSHVIIVLATTELHKVPETIVSRCLRFFFRQANRFEINELLTKVVEAEKLNLPKAAIEVIARRAEGSYRDALSLLTTVVNHPRSDQESTDMSLLLGLPPMEAIESLDRAIQDGQVKEIIRLATEFEKTADTTVLAKGLLDHYEEKLIATDDETTAVALAERVNRLSQIIERARQMVDPGAMTLAGLVRLANSPKIDQEQKQPQKITEPSPEPTRVVDVVKSPSLSETGSVDAVSSAPGQDEPTNFWGELLVAVKSHNHALYMVMRSAALGEVSQQRLVIVVRFRFYADRLSEMKNRKIIESVVEKLLGRSVVLEVQVQASQQEEPTNDSVLQAVVEVFELDKSAD